MRFIFGLIAGALATMLVATALDAPTAEVLKRASDSWQELSSHFRINESATIEPAQLEPKESENSDTMELTASPTPEADALAETEPESMNAANASNEPHVFDAIPPPDNAGEAVVWSPFHSEASASGFARRLSNQLAHPFQVRKQGPANYLVVYSFTDEVNHQSLQQRIAQITGAPSS